MRPDGSLPRRAVLAAGLALVGGGALAAPSAFETRPWLDYEARLRARLADAGGGRFDLAGARQVLQQTNAARADAGAGALTWHEDLAGAAQAHAADLAQRDYVEHLSPEGFDPSHRFWLLARRTVGSPSENIAYHRGGAPATPARLMETWRGSPDHWRNLLRPSHSHAAFGLVRRRDRAYLVGLYAHPLAELARAAPLRVATQGEILAQVQPLPPGLSLILQPPQGSRGGGRGELAAASAVQQISLARRLEGRTFEVIGGPIFLIAPGTST